MSDEFLQKQKSLKKQKNLYKTLKRNKSIENLSHKPLNYFSGYETTDEELQPTKAFKGIDTSLKMADFELLKNFSCHQYSYNWLVKEKSTNTLYFLKIYKNIIDFTKKRVKPFKNLIAVNRISEVFHSSFIIKTCFQFYNENNICFVEEYLPNMSNFDSILHDLQCLEENVVKFYIAELILAIDCLHNSKVIHGDLSLKNIFVDSKGHLKLTGFEFSIIAPNKKWKKPKCIMGTPDYIAPEVLNGSQNKENCFSCDWWALGVVLFEMIVGVAPFNDNTVSKVFDNILNLAIPWNLIKIGNGEDCMSENAADLIKKLLVLDPNQRITRNGSWDLKKHKFFEGIDWIGIRNSKAPIIY